MTRAQLLLRSALRSVGRGDRVALSSWAAEDAGWTELGSRQAALSVESFTGVTRSEMIKALTLLERTNGIAKSIMTLVTGFVASSKIKFTAKNRRVQRVLDEFWESDINAWELRLFKRIKEWRLYGEQLWPVVVNPYNGFVRVLYVSPAQIKDIVVSPELPEEPISVELYSEDGIRAGKRYRVIRMVEGDSASASDGEFVGDAFLLRANTLSVDPRGYSDLLTITEMLAAVEDLVYTSAARAAFQLNWTKHVKVVGAKTIDKRLEEELRQRFNSNRPGTFVATGDNIVVENIVPKLESAQTAEEVKTLVGLISGSTNIPAAWLGFSGSERSALDKITGPTLKMLDTVRRELAYELKLICNYVTLQAVKHGVLSPNTDRSVTVELPAIYEEDSREWGRAIAQITVAAAMAHRNQFITLKTASDMVRRAVSNIGVTYDPEQEVAARLKEQDTISKVDVPNVPRVTQPLESEL